MRRALFIFITLIAGLAPFASAQEHGQAGVYVNTGGYLQLHDTPNLGVKSLSLWFTSVVLSICVRSATYA